LANIRSLDAAPVHRAMAARHDDRVRVRAEADHAVRARELDLSGPGFQ
jgi:hypothetical protein